MEIYLFSKNDYCTLLFKNILNQAEIHIKTFSNYEELKKNIQTNDPIREICRAISNESYLFFRSNYNRSNNEIRFANSMGKIIQKV